MHKQLSKMAVMALFMTESKAAAIVDGDNGYGGKAPCLEEYIGVWESTDVGYKPHAVHGI